MSCDTKKFHDNESTHILHNFWTSTHRREAFPLPGGATVRHMHYTIPIAHMLPQRDRATRSVSQNVVVGTTHTHARMFNGPWSGTTRVSRCQKSETNLDFTEARDSEWQWHQLDHMPVCTSLQTDNHTSTTPLCFLQAGCPSCRPTNSVKALKAETVGTSCTANPGQIEVVELEGYSRPTCSKLCASSNDTSIFVAVIQSL